MAVFGVKPAVCSTLDICPQFVEESSVSAAVSNGCRFSLLHESVTEGSLRWTRDKGEGICSPSSTNFLFLGDILVRIIYTSFVQLLVAATAFFEAISTTIAKEEQLFYCDVIELFSKKSMTRTDDQTNLPSPFLMPWTEDGHGTGCRSTPFSPCSYIRAGVL